MIFIKHGCNLTFVFFPFQAGDSALHIASREGFLEIVKFFLAKQSKVINLPDRVRKIFLFFQSYFLCVTFL